MGFVNGFFRILLFIPCAFAAQPELTIEIKDYATMPITGAFDADRQQCGPAGAHQLSAGGARRIEEAILRQRPERTLCTSSTRKRRSSPPI